MDSHRSYFPRRHPCYAAIGISIILSSVVVSAIMLISMMSVYHDLPPIQVRYPPRLTTDNHHDVVYRFIESIQKKRKEETALRDEQKSE